MLRAEKGKLTVTSVLKTCVCTRGYVGACGIACTCKAEDWGGLYANYGRANNEWRRGEDA